jgi:hypothetical protein
MSANSNLPARPKHGLYIKAAAGYKLRDRKTSRLAQKVRAVLPWLEVADFPAVRAWAEFEILCEQVFAVLRAGSVVNVAGEGKRLLDDYRKLRLAQASIAASLGMTPASRMAIKAAGTHAAFDLPAGMAEAVVDIGESRAAERAGRQGGDDEDGPGHG